MFGDDIGGASGALFMVGMVVMIFGTLRLTAIALQRRGFLWALFVLFIPLIGPIAFALQNRDHTRIACKIYFAGMLLMGMGVAVGILRSFVATFASY